MPEDTTIRVKHETWRRLHEQKDPGDSFDQLIRRLLDEQEATADA